MGPSRSLRRLLVAELQIARTTRRLTKTSVPTPAGCNQRTSSKLRGKDGFSAVPFELPRQLRKAVDSRQAEAGILRVRDFYIFAATVRRGPGTRVLGTHPRARTSAANGSPSTG